MNRGIIKPKATTSARGRNLKTWTLTVALLNAGDTNTGKKNGLYFDNYYNNSLLK
jgi:hypothetical protein